MPSPDPDNPDTSYRLAAFAESVLLPAARRETRDAWAQGLTLEAFLWLDLGVKIGAFPEDTARALVRSVDEPVQDAIRAFSEDDLLPDYVAQIAQRSFDGGEYHVKDTGSFVNSSGVVPLFETLMYCATEHGRTRHAEDLFVMLSIANDDRWEQMKSELVVPYLMSRRQDDITNAARLVEAFTSSLGYWIDMDVMLQAVRDDEGDDRSNRIALAGDASAIQIWKFNIALPQVRERVQVAGEIAMAALPEIEPGVVLAMTEAKVGFDLQEKLDNLMQRWQSRIEYAVGTATLA